MALVQTIENIEVVLADLVFPVYPTPFKNSRYTSRGLNLEDGQ